MVIAQFKRTLFATSYFGKSFTFTGEYATRVVDAGDAFTGVVDLKIKATLPKMAYPMTSDSWSLPMDWSLNQANKTARTQKNGVSATFFACGDIFTLHFQKAAGNGTVSVSVKGDTGAATTYTVDTATTDKLDFQTPYSNRWVTITTTSTKPIVLVKAEARVASLVAFVRSSPTYQGNDPSGLTVETPVEFPNGLVPDRDGYIIARTSQVLTNQRAVSAKFQLATSDTDPKSTPVLDALVFSSGDINEYAEKGTWSCALNFQAIAAQEGASFKKTKRVTFSVANPPEKMDEKNPNWWDEYLAIRSTSKVNNTGSTSIPSEVDIKNPSYWKAETATYRTYQGKVVPRVSLGQAGNGFSATKLLGSALYGPYSARSLGYDYTTITQWREIYQTVAFPPESAGTALVLQLWDTKEIEKYLPIYEMELGAGNTPPRLPLSLSQAYPELYFRVVFRSVTGKQTPVWDYQKITNQMHYQKSLVYQNNQLSGLDNWGKKDLPSCPVGTKRLKTIEVVDFSIPAKGTRPTFTLEYTPRYPNQEALYFGDASGRRISEAGVLVQPARMQVYSLTQPEEPSASTQLVDPSRLTWHYQYDGGSVLYPNKAQREVGTDFNPMLTKNKKYRLLLLPGWQDEHFRLPKNMTWEEVAEIVGHEASLLQQKNPNVITYGGNLPAGSILLLPNETNNPMVSLKFLSTQNQLTERSLWNGTSQNEQVQAEVTGEKFEAVDWTSEERFFTGILNPGNLMKSYLRTQKIGTAEANSKELTNRTGSPLRYIDVARENGIVLEDILLANNQLAHYQHPEEALIQPGERYVVPAPPNLPVLPPEVWFEGENPYRVEVVPGTVRRTDDNLLLADDTLLPGSDDEPPIRYTLRDSQQKNQNLVRGNFAHGRDTLPYANVRSIVKITGTDGTVYTPYVKSGGSETGDYLLKGNTVDWSPAHSRSKEPRAGESYTVTFIHGMVDTLQVLYTSSYKEKAAFDKLWRSRHIQTVEAIVGPGEDQLLPLPDGKEYPDFRNDLKNLSYVVEDDDLWVQSSVIDTPDGKRLLLTMNGKDPKRNWHPTIETGFYYLNDEEYYLYSEPMEHTFGKESIPILEGISYGEKGLQLKEQ